MPVPNGTIQPFHDVVVLAVICQMDVADVGVVAVAAAFGDTKFLLPGLDVARESVRDNLLRLLVGEVPSLREDRSGIMQVPPFRDAAHEEVAGLTVHHMPEPLPLTA